MKESEVMITIANKIKKFDLFISGLACENAVYLYVIVWHVFDLLLVVLLLAEKKRCLALSLKL